MFTALDVHATNTYEGVVINLHAFLTSVLDGGGCSASLSCHLQSPQRLSGPFEDDKNYFQLQEIEIRFLGLPVLSSTTTELKQWICKARNTGPRLSDDSRPPLLHCRRWTARRQAVWRQVPPRGRSDAVPGGNRRPRLFRSDFVFAFKAFSLPLRHWHKQLRKRNCKF